MHLDDVGWVDKTSAQASGQRAVSRRLCALRRKSGDYLRQMTEVGA
jgi:hypothetical protein